MRPCWSARGITGGLIALGLLAPALLSTGVSAQYVSPRDTAVTDRVQAREFLREGRAKLRDGDYAGAADRFRRSLQLEPRIVVKLNLAYALALAGEIPKAVAQYRQLLHRRSELTKEQIRSIRERLAEMESKLGTLRVRGSGRGRTQVYVDGQLVGSVSPTSQLNLSLPVGLHYVETTSPGQPRRAKGRGRAVTLMPAQEMVITVPVTAGAVAIRRGRAPSRRSAQSPPPRRGRVEARPPGVRSATMRPPAAAPSSPTEKPEGKANSQAEARSASPSRFPEQLTRTAEPPSAPGSNADVAARDGLARARPESPPEEPASTAGTSEDEAAPGRSDEPTSSVPTPDDSSKNRRGFPNPSEATDEAPPPRSETPGAGSAAPPRTTPVWGAASQRSDRSPVPREASLGSESMSSPPSAPSASAPPLWASPGRPMGSPDAAPAVASYEPQDSSSVPSWVWMVGGAAALVGVVAAALLLSGGGDDPRVIGEAVTLSSF